MRTIRDCPFVIVEWEDSAEYQGGWRNFDGFEGEPPLQCLTAGWVVFEDKDSLAIAGSLADYQDDREHNFQVNSPMQIPKRAIIRTLEGPEAAARLLDGMTPPVTESRYERERPFDEILDRANRVNDGEHGDEHIGAIIRICREEIARLGPLPDDKPSFIETLDAITRTGDPDPALPVLTQRGPHAADSFETKPCKLDDHGHCEHCGYTPYDPAKHDRIIALGEYAKATFGVCDVPVIYRVKDNPAMIAPETPDAS